MKKRSNEGIEGYLATVIEDAEGADDWLEDANAHAPSSDLDFMVNRSQTFTDFLDSWIAHLQTFMLESNSVISSPSGLHAKCGKSQ